MGQSEALKSTSIKEAMPENLSPTTIKAHLKKNDGIDGGGGRY